MKKLPKDSRMGSSSGRKGHGLSVHFNIFTTCILSLSVSVCLWQHVGCVSLWAYVCVLACGSLQTDNHRGGRAESKRDECSVYWNERKDRLQCQTGRMCVCVCVHVYVVPCVRWSASLSHWHENINREHEMLFVYLLFKLSHQQGIIHIYYWIKLSSKVGLSLRASIPHR